MSTPTGPLPQDNFAAVTSEPGTTAVALSADNPPWFVPGAVGFWVLSVLLILFMPLFFLIPYANRQGISLQALPEFALTDKTAIFLQVVSTIPAHLLTLGLAWLLVTRVGKFSFRASLGWVRDQRFNFWRSAAVAVGLYLVGISIIYLFGGPETQLDKLLNSSRLTALTVAFMATATAPLVEEVVYRGVLYSALQRAIGSVWAGALVLSLFALVHVRSTGRTSESHRHPHLSAVLTVIRARTGKLLPCFIIHLVFTAFNRCSSWWSRISSSSFPNRCVGLSQPRRSLRCSAYRSNKYALRSSCGRRRHRRVDDRGAAGRARHERVPVGARIGGGRVRRGLRAFRP